VGQTVWDAEAVRDDLRGYVTEYLSDDDAVLIVDETGDLRRASAPSRCSGSTLGSAGQIENAQAGMIRPRTR
jgi:SRSO17 transposase